MSRHPEDAPPPGVWLAVLVLVALLVLPAYGAFRLGWLADVGDRDTVASQWLRYRQDMEGSVIMGVGSSLLEAGVAHAELTADGRSQWLLFHRWNANYQNFGALLQRRWPVQPRVLIVHTDMFQIEKRDPKAFLSLVQTLIRPAMRWVLGRGLPPSDEIFPYADAPPGDAEKTAALAALYRPRPAEQTQVIEWLKLQQSQGSRVVLLDIPRSASVERAIGAPLVRWRADMRVIAERLQMPLLRFDGPLTDADFHDGSHMRQSGRRRHTRWLQQEVRGLLHECS